MSHLLPSRTPGEIVLAAAGYIFYAALVMMLMSGTIHDLRKKPEGTPEIGRMGPLGAGIALGLSQAVRSCGSPRSNGLVGQGVAGGG
jgi:hypothetical protein